MALVPSFYELAGMELSKPDLSGIRRHTGELLPPDASRKARPAWLLTRSTVTPSGYKGSGILLFVLLIISLFCKISTFFA